MAKVTWMNNIGQIVPSDNSSECFWMVPEVFVWQSEWCISSPQFSLVEGRWRLVIMPSDGVCCYETKTDCVALFLWREDPNLEDQEYIVYLGLKSKDGRDHFSFDGETCSNYGCGKWNFLDIRCDPGVVLAAYGRMKIFCVMRKKRVMRDHLLSSDEESEEDAKIEAKGVDRLVQNFTTLLHDGQHSDAVLKVEDTEVPVHRGILAVRSPVFASMIENDMAGKKSDVIEISDCTFESFEVFLLYLYTGCASTMTSGNVLNLYYAADKYCVDDLKAECVEFMKSTLSVDTFCDVIALSLQHEESKLQKAATLFFCENINKIIQTAKWNKYMSENSTQANKFLIKVLNQNSELKY